MSIADALGTLRKPEYTGENRCLPCTGVNGLFAVVFATLLAIILPLGTAGSLAIGGIALFAFGAAIYLRGYLVPGTPELTKTYFPDWFLRYFDHYEPHPPTEGAVDPMDVFDEAGAVTECEQVDDLCLTEDFRAAWDEAIERLREGDTSRADLAAVIDVPEDALHFMDHGSAFVALADVATLRGPGEDGRRRVGQWESRSAFIADMAGAGVLRDRYPPWDELPPDQQGQVLNGLRIFLERCPTCGGAVEFGEKTVESCCRSMAVVAVTCESCGDRLFEAEAPAAA